MQIRPGGEKLSDTKVGEFDRGPLLFRLSAMQPMQQAPPPIITDSVIRTTAACWPWNRLPSCTEQNEKERENSTDSISEKACAFFFSLLLSGNEQMVINVRRVNLPSLCQVFPADTIFSVQGRKWNFSVLRITSRLNPSPSTFIRISFAEEE